MTYTKTPCSQDLQHSYPSGGVNEVPWAVVGLTPHIQETHECAKDTVQGGSQPHPSGCLFEVGRIQETHFFWCCTGSLFAPSWTMVALCMAQRRTPIYDIQTASITLDWDWRCECSALAQCPVCTKRPTKFLGRSCPCITIWRLMPALRVQHILPFMNSTEPLDIFMLPGQMGEEAWPDLRPLLLVSK